jgi:hypothetical protein
MSFLPRIKYGINSSRNPGKHWIPGQARNDKLDKIYVVMYRNEGRLGSRNINLKLI